MIKIDDAERPGELGGVAGESPGGVIDERDRDAFGVWLLQFEWNAYLSVAAFFPLGGLVWHLFSSNTLLMLLERHPGFVGAADCHERPTQTVRRAEMILLKRDHLLQQCDGFLGIAGGQLGLAKQVTHRAHGVVDIIGLLQRLGGFSGLIKSQISTANQEMSRGEIDVDGQRFLRVLDDFRWVVGQAMGVGQVQQEVDLRGFGFQRPGKCSDGFLRLAGLVVGFAGIDRLVEVGIIFAGRAGQPGEDHRGEHHQDEQQQVFRQEWRLARAGVSGHARQNNGRCRLDQGGNFHYRDTRRVVRGDFDPVDHPGRSLSSKFRGKWLIR